MKRAANRSPIVRPGGAVFLAMLFLAPAGWTVLMTGTPAARTAAGAERKRVAVFDSLTRLIPELRYQGAWLKDVVDFLREFGSMTVVVEWRRLESFKIKDDTPVTVNARNISVEDALKKVLGQLGDAQHRPAFAEVGDVIVISTPAGIEAHTAAAKALAAAQPNSGLRDLLNHRLPEANLQGAPLADALTFVKDAAKLPTDVDWKGLQEAGVDRKATITVDLSDIPAGQALCLIIASVDSKKPVGVTVDGEKVRVGPLPAPQK